MPTITLDQTQIDTLRMGLGKLVAAAQAADAALMAAVETAKPAVGPTGEHEGPMGQKGISAEDYANGHG